jgi:hypothetical protein
MAVWSNYWRIITPPSRKTSYQPSNELTRTDNNSNGYAAFSSTSWYSNVLRGPMSRLSGYKQYESMDSGDVARALDIIAEEMSNPDKRTELPFLIDYHTEDNQDVSDLTVTTLRAALRMWSKMHKLGRRVFDISREMTKYGDSFFIKTSDTEEWEHVVPERVVGIEVNDKGVPVAYHIKPKDPQNNNFSKEETLEIYPAAAVLHFSLSNNMGAGAPFGESLLKPAYRDWQKLQMLEDAAIIYKIVRAPERRVFYIDVGNKPAHLVKQYLDQIKNDIRQRRIPNASNAQTTDGQYNPESIQEDYYFPVTAAGRGSRVETLAGGTTWETPELDHFLAKVFRALRVPTSYMKGADAQGAQYNDGKVGIAYIEELRFANFVQRLQTNLEDVFDAHFKAYLQTTGINIDPDMFTLRLPEPQNFALYRQSALDTELINSFKSIEDVPYLSKRFMLERYLGLTKEEIQMNEAMLREERGIIEGTGVTDVRAIYDENAPTPEAEEPMDEPGGNQMSDEPFGDVPADEPADEEPPEDAPDLGVLDSGEEPLRQ